MRFLLVMLMAGFLAGCKGDPPPVAPPEVHLTDLTLERLNGTEEPLSAYLGKVVILNVWATWCAPCRVEMPDLEELADILGEEQFAVLGVSYDEDPEAAREYISQFRLTFASHIDSEGHRSKQLLTATELPTTIIFGPDGKAVAKVVGARDWVSQEWIDRVKSYR